MIRVRLEDLLREKGKSRYWLAKQTGLTPLTITKLFRGETNGIDFPTLNAICKALNCQTSEVIKFENEEQEENSR